jgi:microcystin-dependent protein
MDPFIGEIRIFSGNFAPSNWAICNGSLLSISQNTALFSLLGTTYGGDGRTTFALPDLRSRVPVHQGNNFDLGQMAGVESVALTSSEIPSHNHSASASTETPSPVGSGIDLTGATVYVPASVPRPPCYVPNGASVAMAPQAVQLSGGSVPHNNIAPYLAINFIIALNGVFPSRP